MKRIWAVWLMLFALPGMVLGAFAQKAAAERPAFFAPAARPDQTPDGAVQALTATFGEAVNAAAALVMEAQTGRVLFAQGETEKLPIASTTKIMTALLALEQPDVYAEFAVEPEMLQVEGSSMGLQEGDRVSLHALSVGLLLASGNDAANVTAARISGSIPAFAEQMNARAAAIGMTNTAFDNPSGLDSQAHYSTAYDLALLAREALKNADFRAICSQYRMRTSYGNPPYDRWLVNHNKLLNYCEGVIGVKTGFTKKAGRCLVSAAERDGITLICVTLDCPDDWTVHQNMYDRFFAELCLQELSELLPEVHLPVTGGTSPTVLLACQGSMPLPLPNAGLQLTFQIRAPQFLYAPVRKGQYVGEAVILADGEPIHTFALTATESVAQRSPPKESIASRIGEWIQNRGYGAAQAALQPIPLAAAAFFGR
jgi:D-alanyl-D-alanine carboxypeptidase